MQEEIITLRCKINGEERTLDINRRLTLLDLLREKLELTGSKYGCGTGDCGACMVLIDGEPVTSCTYLAVRAEGKEIVTIEGLAPAGRLSPVQQAFVDAGAVQCGFCIPGMVITATALLRRQPNPTRQQIADSLDHNLCRCTGYVKIVDAIELAARRMQSGAQEVQHG